jgi:hypothetical protein
VQKAAISAQACGNVILIPLDAIRHVLTGQPLSPAIAEALDPAAFSDHR